MEEVIIKCPRYKFCSVNVCPLDISANLRNRLDGEPRCGVAKRIRLKIGTEYKLPKLGLSNAEFSAHQKWQSKTEEEKDGIRKQMTKVRASILSQNPL